MKSDNDPQELALEHSPEKVPEIAPAQTAHNDLGNAAEKTGEEAPETDSPRLSLLRRLMDAGGRALRRLKQFLQTGASRITAAGKGLLQRLRNRGKTPHEEDRKEDQDRHSGDSSETPLARRKPAAPPNSPGAPPPATEAIKAVEPRSPVRSFFVYLLVLIIGGIAGMTFSFALLSTMITNQAQRIGDQRDEIAKIETQLSRIQQSEAKYRWENMEYQKKLIEVEKELNSAMQNPGRNAPPSESGGKPSAPTTGKPPVTIKNGDCTLEPGKIGDNLTRCINELNRK